MYVVPQVQVQQQFSINPQSTAAVLRATVLGPAAELFRYANEDEKSQIGIGFYDRLVDTDYAWPGRPVGGVVDFDYVKLFAEDALLHYYYDAVGGSGGANANVTAVATGGNKVTSGSFVFKTANGSSRNAALYDRDVKIGDVVKLSFPTRSKVLWTYVKGIDAVMSAASASASATADGNNPATSVAATVATQVHGAALDNKMAIASSSAASYSPYKTGKTVETYTIIVTQGSSGGDLTTARLRVISASGLDDVASVTPSASGVATAIGTLGATATFDDSGTATATDIPASDFVVGQKWTLQVTAAYTQPTTLTVSGTYTGTINTTYLVEVIEGGTYANDDIRIVVRTSNGYDASGPTYVPTVNTAVPIGTKGLSMLFNPGSGLLKGDRFYITATAAAPGACRTLVLGHALPSPVVATDAAEISLYIRKPLLEIPRIREDSAPLTNYEVSDTEITIKSGITVLDAEWTNNGIPMPIAVHSDVDKDYGRLFVQYRAFVPASLGSVTAVPDVGELNSLLPGPLDPDNPLKWAVSKALANSGGVSVLAVGVNDPNDLDQWVEAIDVLNSREDVYGIVPLTKNKAVLDLVQAHVQTNSSPERGMWRVAWINLHAIPETPLVHAGLPAAGYAAATTEDGEVALALVADDPATGAVDYSYLTVPAGNANFVTNKVQAGDVVRHSFGLDDEGNPTYVESTIDEVYGEDALRLRTPLSAPISVASKIEVWRRNSPSEEATEIARFASSFGSRRVRAVWPDKIGSGGTLLEGYHLCAALAGLTSGVLAQQGLTNVEISGFDDVSRTTTRFRRDQLDTMAGGGVWIVTQEPNDGEIFTRHAVTTGDTEDINQREEMITRNVDSISYRFRQLFAPFIGRTNVVDATIDQLRIRSLSLIETLKTEGAQTQIGGQLVDGEIVTLRPDTVLADRIVAVININPPEPFNNALVVLQV